MILTPSLYPAQRNTSWIISRLPAVLNHLERHQALQWHIVKQIEFSIPLASIIWNNLNVNFLENVGNCRCAMSNASPSSDSRHFSYQLSTRWRQANWNDVLLELHVSVQFYQRDVVLEVAGRVVWMNFFSLDQVFLVRQSLILIFHVVLAQPHFKIRVWCCCNAVSWNYSSRLVPLNLAAL